jgi:uncharacterized coiled-coil protein SlyX
LAGVKWLGEFGRVPFIGRPQRGNNRAIIGRLRRALLLLLLPLCLAGCGALRVAYSTAPQLAWWWADGYMDFERDHGREVKGAIDRWFEWHRSTQLAPYAAFLAQAQPVLLEPTSAAAICGFNARARELLLPALERGLAQGADLVPGLTEAQFKHLEQRYAKNLDDMRGDYLQADPAERRRATLKRTRERSEQLYGRLNDTQRQLIEAGVNASPFDPQGWFEERQRRQRDTLQTLRRLVATKADRDQRQAALRTLLERSERSPEPSYRAYQRQLTDYNCAFVARIHNASTREQRLKAQATLKGWEEDLRALLAGGAVRAGDPSQ